MYVCMFVFEREQERERKSLSEVRGGGGCGGSGSPLSRKPDTGLHPGTLGMTKLKADTQSAEPPRRPGTSHFEKQS